MSKQTIPEETPQSSLNDDLDHITERIAGLEMSIIALMHVLRKKGVLPVEEYSKALDLTALHFQRQMLDEQLANQTNESDS